MYQQIDLGSMSAQKSVLSMFTLKYRSLNISSDFGDESHYFPDLRHVYYCVQLSLILYLREPTHSIVSQWVNIFQTEFMAEIYSESPLRAIGKVLLMTVS